MVRSAFSVRFGVNRAVRAQETVQGASSMRHRAGEALRVRYRSAWVALVGVLSAGLAVAAPAADEAFSCERDARASEVVAVTTTLAGVPVIVRFPNSVTKPPIILWHGFGPPASEGALMAALPLDDVPAVKVYLGLPNGAGR
jgi:hypothetical protein